LAEKISSLELEVSASYKVRDDLLAKLASVNVEDLQRELGKEHQANT
jgi:hypothetical protein